MLFRIMVPQRFRIATKCQTTRYAQTESRWHRQVQLAKNAIVDFGKDADCGTIFIVDRQRLVHLYETWKTMLPDVRPFYAVKCNPEPFIMQTIAKLGGGFDCASEAELDSALSVLGEAGAGDSIILAHPCKRPRDLKKARTYGVALTVLDARAEIDKIAMFHPESECLLRIRCDDPEARVNLGKKYGADIEDAPQLIEDAKRKGVRIRGICFHVGSSAQTASAFVAGIGACVDILEKHPEMDTIDIGGGFSSHTFPIIAPDLSMALRSAYRRVPRLKGHVMAEPGRFFAETVGVLCVMVYGVRQRSSGKMEYWISDGLYGSLNCILYDRQHPQFSVLRSPYLPEMPDSEEKPSVLWGPTCDSADCVYENVQLPVLRVGDYIIFHDAGAYTLAGACGFNGIQAHAPHMYIS